MCQQRGYGIANQGISRILRKMNCGEIVRNGLKTHSLTRCNKSRLTVMEVGTDIWTPEIGIDRVGGAGGVKPTICRGSPAGLLEV